MTVDEALDWATKSNWTGGVERAVIEVLAAEVRRYRRRDALDKLALDSQDMGLPY